MNNISKVTLLFIISVKCDLIKRVMDLGETLMSSFICVILFIFPSITIQKKVSYAKKISMKKNRFSQKYSQDEEFESITDLSERQLAEFTMLGKFKLGQIRYLQEYLSVFYGV